MRYIKTIIIIAITILQYKEGEKINNEKKQLLTGPAEWEPRPTATKPGHQPNERSPGLGL